MASALIDNVPLVAATQGMYSLTAVPPDSQLWQLIALCAGVQAAGPVSRASCNVGMQSECTGCVCACPFSSFPIAWQAVTQGPALRSQACR